MKSRNRKLKVLAVITLFSIFLMISSTIGAAQIDKVALNEIQQAIEAKGADWTAGETSVSGLSVEEQKMLCGAEIGPIPEAAMLLSPPNLSSVPTTFDWRTKDGQNWVTPVEDQGQCGSCWIFGATAAFETQINIDANDPTIDFDASEQYILSCFSGGWGCGGGDPADTLEFIKDNGVPDDACLPYQANDGISCSAACSDWQDRAWTCANYGTATTHTTAAYKTYLQTYGPMVVVLEVPNDFLYYTGGLYEPVWTTDEFGVANHCVMLVGYDDTYNGGSGCWIIKNSWGTSWGENGYARVAYGDLEQYNYAFWVLDTSEPEPEPEPPEIVVLNDTVENTGWSESYWDETGLWHVTERRANSPTHSWWYGKESTGNYDTGGANSGCLVSQEIDLTDATAATLTYWTYWSTESSSSYDLKRVEVSVNGGAWALLEQLPAGTGSGTRTITLPVKNPIKIRFYFNTKDNLYNNYEGWFIDDITVETELPTAPDLTITSKSEENVGGGFNVTYTVKNIGDGAAGASNTAIRVDGETVYADPVSALAVNASYTNTVGPFECPCETTVTVSACADTDNSVTESNEANNCEENEWACPPCIIPDLIITDLSETIFGGGGFTMNYTVANIGNGAAGASNTAICVDGETVYEDPVPALAVGENYTSTVGPFDCICGETPTVLACADTDNSVTESNETNNCEEKGADCPGAELIYVNTTGWWRAGGVFNQSSTPIQAAIDAAQGLCGITIHVAAGTYPEQVKIEDKSLALIGAGDGAEAASSSIIKPASLSKSPILATPDSDTYCDYILAAYTTDYLGTQEEVKVTGFRFDANDLDRNDGTRYAGVFMRDISGTEPGDAGLIDCTVANFGTADGNYGLYLLGNSELAIEGNTFSGYTGDGIASYSHDEVVISNNVVTGPGKASDKVGSGIVTATYDAPCTISGNKISSHSSAGILVDNKPANTVTITGNNEISDCEDGIGVNNSAYVTLDSNTITSCDSGMRLYNGAHHLAITNNIFTGNVKAISVEEPLNPVTDVEVHDNRIAGNVMGIDNDCVNEVDATYNWWGDCSGPYHAVSNPTGAGDNVSDNVSFMPWYGMKRVYLLPQDSNETFGQDVPVEIWVNHVVWEDACGFKSGQIKLTYDSGCANVTAYTGNTPIFPMSGWTHEAGSDWITFVTAESSLSSGLYQIGTLTIQGVNESAEGTTALNFTEPSALFDLEGVEVRTVWVNGSFTCSGIYGDVNADGAVNMGDVGALHNYVQSGDPKYISNPWAADVNCASGINMGDVGLLHNYVQYGSPQLNCCSS
jgi:parallel beta-helix repeat protein